jgi:hypothetical protein
VAFIYREWQVVAASVFAVVVISGAYLVAKGDVTPPIAEAATETALLQQIANRDSTGDGVPDWEKPLYGIPLNATTTDYFGLGMTDGEAIAKGLVVPVAQTPEAPTSTAPVPDTPASFGLTAPAPGSLTDSFAQNFFALYLAAEEQNGGSLTDDQINSVADQALTQLSNSVAPAPDFKTAADIQVSGSGSTALEIYAANAQNVLAKYGISLPESELDYLQDYLNGDTTALSKLGEIATEYTQIAAGLAALTVPAEAASVDLEIVNATARMGEIINDFSNVSTDPLTAMLSLQQYPQAVETLSQSYTDLANLYASEHIVLAPGTPGAQFVNAATYIASPTTTTAP